MYIQNNFSPSPQKCHLRPPSGRGEQATAPRPPVFVNSFIGTQRLPFVHRLSVAAFELNNRVGIWPATLWCAVI